jgi:hypothetical protein
MHLAVTQHAERALMRTGEYPAHSIKLARNCSAALSESVVGHAHARQSRAHVTRSCHALMSRAHVTRSCHAKTVLSPCHGPSPSSRITRSCHATKPRSRTVQPPLPSRALSHALAVTLLRSRSCGRALAVTLIALQSARFTLEFVVPKRVQQRRSGTIWCDLASKRDTVA